ncbi:DNA topoisomerase III, partial [Azospirillum sp. C340-1]|nr:DNA topoisomerase III [Azospirillum isscasi]
AAVGAEGEAPKTPRRSRKAKAAPEVLDSITPAAAAAPPTPAPLPNGARRKAPTDKMVAFARSLADRKGVELPDAVLQDFDSCRQFLDRHAR